MMSFDFNEKGEILFLGLGLIFFWLQVKRGKKMKGGNLGFNF
jgi:hypothetical protein